MLKQFCNRLKVVGVPKLVETKNTDDESVTDSIRDANNVNRSLLNKNWWHVPQ